LTRLPAQQLREDEFELTQDDRRRLARIVLHASADVAERKALARREEHLQKEVSIIRAQRTVATLRRACHPVELVTSICTRELVLIEAEYTDAPKGDRSKGKERAKRDPTRQKVGTGFARVELRRQKVNHATQAQARVSPSGRRIPEFCAFGDGEDDAPHGARVPTAATFFFDQEI